MLKYRPDIDGLRAIAVLLVVAFHAAPGVVPGGYVGVDIFFVISGFLITGILQRALEAEKFSLGWFYSRRARRIFPALVMVLLFVCAAGWFLLLPDQYERLGQHVAGGAAFISNLLLWQESGYFDAAASSKPLLHLWSLGIEEQFYIVWPLLLFVAHRLKLHLLGVLAVVVLFSFVFSVWQVSVDPVAAFYSPFSRFWELGLGGLLACHGLQETRVAIPRWWSEIKAVAGCVLIALVVLLLDKDSKFPGWWALMPTLGAALLISAGPGAWINRRVLSLRGMVAIGLISYPLYLWHWPLLTFLHIHESGDPSRASLAAIVLLSFVLAWLTWRFVEKPVRFGQGKHTRFRLGVVCGLLVVMCGVGLTVQARAGFTSRFPGQIQALAKFKYDPAIPYRSHHCFLVASDPASALQECIDGGKALGKPVVLLWGDSYAAALYPGYKHALAGNARLLQVNAVGCPPTVNSDSNNKRCASITAEVMRRVSAENVERVVIAANWVGQGWPTIEHRVAAGIAELRHRGVQRIDLVGELPEWPKTLPVTMFDAYKADGQLHQRLPNEALRGRATLEKSLESFAHQQNVRYISPARILCNKQGCLTMIGGRLDQLTSFDRGHLTVPASEFLVQRFPQ